MNNLYKKINNGYLQQKELTGPLPNYSTNYSNIYNLYTTNESMSEVRFNLLTKIIKSFNSITDFGYGNGSFIYYCEQQGKKVYGYDISDYPVPSNCVKLNDVNDASVDVITFFDSLEHLVDSNLIPFLQNLKTKYVCISVPWYHEEQGTEWFMNWKHRRENEHIHHFDSHGLVDLLQQSGYKVLYLNNDEDQIRIPVDELPNILTVIAKKL